MGHIWAQLGTLVTNRFSFDSRKQLKTQRTQQQIFPSVKYSIEEIRKFNSPVACPNICNQNQYELAKSGFPLRKIHSEME